MALISVLMRKRQRKILHTHKHTHTHTQERYVRMEAEVGVMHPQSTNAGSYQKLEKTENGFSPRAFKEIAVLLTP